MPLKQPQEDFEKKYLECNNKFESIFKLTSAASKIIASDLTILRVNHALTELMGFSAEEIEGTKILEYACEEYKEHWHQLQEAMWQHHKPFFKLEACLIKKDKTVVWVSVTTVQFKEGDETYAFTVLDDITYRKQFEEAEKRLDMALQYAKMAVWEMNLQDYSVIRCNNHDGLFGYEKQLKYWSKETYLHHLLREDHGRFEQAINSARLTFIFDFQGRIQTADGAIKWIDMQGKAGTDHDGKPVKILGTIKDITKEKLNERHKDEFISTVSHELKTPVTSIKAQAQILERKFVAASDIAMSLMLRRINLQVNRLTNLISDLLEVARIDEQELPLRKEAYPFNEMVEETVVEIQRTTTSHNLIISNNSPKVCYGDRGRTSQVLSNLLTNAIKYSPGKDKVIINVEERQGRIICSVQDFGIGIEEARQPHIFERFYRAADDQNYSISGLGLGLYICYEIIKRLNGAIWLESKLGEGSIFYFSLPKNI